MCNYAENLAAPEIKWLGVHPSDMKIRNMVTLPLQKCDLLKLNTLSRAIFIKSNKQLLKQVEKKFMLIFLKVCDGDRRFFFSPIALRKSRKKNVFINYTVFIEIKNFQDHFLLPIKNF